MMQRLFVTGRFDGTRLKALVVDDNAPFRRLLRTVLESLDIAEIREAKDGAEALDALREFPADFILLDWQMEPMDGLSCTLKLRRSADSPNPSVPIIMLTANHDPALEREARNAGVNEVLHKPLSARALINRVVSVVVEPRPFVRAGVYVGPDRRRHRVTFGGIDRRCAPQGAA